MITEQVSDSQLARYATLIYDKTGIRISPQKKMLLSNRLRRRLRATGIENYDRYLHHLRGLTARDDEWDAFLQEITTHETYLFRDDSHWNWFCNEYLDEVARQARAGQRRQELRVWSAASSTGDEAYTIAACIADRLKDHDSWKVKIVGTDIGIGAVQQAREATFNERAMKLVPDSIRRRFFQKAREAELWTPKTPLSDWTSFEQHNLMLPLSKPPFDVIFVKNVLIYFDANSKQTVVANVLKALKPGGFLVTGPAEGVTDLLKDMERLSGWLHRKR